MQRRISVLKIKKKLHKLQNELPRRPTVTDTPFVLPKSLSTVVRKSNFSQTSLQKMSDSIGCYLGLLNSVKVTIGIESSEHMMAPAGSSDKVGQPGLYSVKGGGVREIQITKKFRFKLKHILAILAHECTHNYLFHHGVRESDEAENEILTDIATAYLGLGHLIIPGYKPITWTSDYWTCIIASGYTTHTTRIGYVTSGVVRKAIIISAKARKLLPREVVTSLYSIWDKLVVSLFLLPYGIRLRNDKNKKIRNTVFMERRCRLLKDCKDKIDEIDKIHNKLGERINRISHKRNASSVDIQDGHMIVEISNKIALGEVTLKTKEILETISKRGVLDNKNKKLHREAKRIKELRNVVFGWDKLLSKYDNDTIYL